jgi:polysaccharide chain length determinant protein (PEP-CTERM system associated)
MQEIIVQLISHIRSTWRYRWYMVLIACPLCIGGWVMVQTLPDQYEASARVYLDTASVLRPLMKGLAVNTNVRSQIDIMTKTLLSRPNLEKVARMTDLDLKAKTPDQMSALLDRLSNKIRLEEVPRARDFYKIKYENSDPQLAKKVVQSLLTIFVENTLGESRKDTDVAQGFLDQQIKEYEARLVAAENRLRDFKRRNIGRMPGEGKDYYENLQAAIGDLEQAQMQLNEAQNRRKELQRQLEDQASMPAPSMPATTVGTSATPELDARINNLQTRLDELLLKYTDQHPDVIAVKRTIADLEKQKKEVLAAQAKTNQGREEVQSTNPYEAQLKLAVSEADANVAALKARVASFQQRVDQLKKLVNIIPEVEAQLKQLNRDYDVTKRNYELLLARRESAGLSEQMDQNSNAVKFRVVDPPFVPPQPSGPDRPLLTSGALGGGIVAGLVFAIFLAQLNPTFDSRRSLMEATNLPVLGGVSMIWTAGQLRRKRMDFMGFSLVIVLLLGLYSAVMAMQILDINPIAHLKGLL